jgi:imidazoleglycerol-phosphate dehydratase
MERKSKVERKTKETDISLSILIDGKGEANIDTGVGFFDHMLTLMAMHGQMDLGVSCCGDTNVDNHHSVEDIGIVLGKAFKEAIGDKKGIKRYATEYTPMDEALSMVSVDISGRPYLHFNVPFEREFAGTLETEMVEEFFRAFAFNAEITLHINLMYGRNTHHIIESIFKGFGRALGNAARLDERIQGVMSTKGLL